MITNISTHHSNTTLSRSQGGALSRSGARVILHTAAALSMASPRRIETGRERKKRTAVQTNARASLPVAQRQQQDRKVRQSGVRIRERAQEPEAARLSALKDSKGRKGRSVQQGHPAGGRTGSTPAEGSRRQQRRAEMALLDDLARAHDRQRSDARIRCTREIAAPVYQHSFPFIKDNPDGCYRLVENIVLLDDQAQQLPIGSRDRPFTGLLDSDGHSLTLNLTRSRGDAVLFGAIENSRIHLALVDAQLVTHHGSRAALIGTMGSGNQVRISGLRGNLFSATGEGVVEAGLVARTTGAGNRLELSDARNNTLEARALPGSSHRAQASLGLGVVEASGKQFVSQQRVEGNQVSARAMESLSSGEASQSARRTALAGLLGLLDAGPGTGQKLKSLQQAVRDNQVTALTTSTIEDGSVSCASLGYAGLDCGRHTEAAHWNRTLWISQASCIGNSVQALAPGSGNRTTRAQPVGQDGLARAALVSTEAVFRLRLLHRDTGPDQLQSKASVAQRALLPPTRKAHVLLLSGGDASVPLFGSWGGAHNCSVTRERWVYWLDQGDSALDTAGYKAQAFNCQPNPPGSWLSYDTRKGPGWGRIHAAFTAFERRFADLPPELLWGYYEPALHYPHERLQSLMSTLDTGYWRSEWQLVTRQHYPWQPEKDAGGLLRIIRYRPPRTPGARPSAVVFSPMEYHRYTPGRSDAPLQSAMAVQGLRSPQNLFQLYHSPGQPVQLVALPGSLADAVYRLTQYDELAGQARLLSMEQGELHLWMQQENKDVLLAWGLGAAAPVSNSSAWPHWGFDLSDQPGGPAVLARAGDWLYSLRQEEGQTASLRRLNISTGEMDPLWQPAWPGDVTKGLRLVVDDDHLVALPTGTLIDPWRRDTGFQAQVPYIGGRVQWQRLPLARHPLSPVPCCPASPGSEATDASSVTPMQTQESRVLEGLKGAGYALPAVGVAVAINGVVIAVLCRKHRRQLAEREAFDARQLAEQSPRVEDATQTLAEETAV